MHKSAGHQGSSFATFFQFGIDTATYFFVSFPMTKMVGNCPQPFGQGITQAKHIAIYQKKYFQSPYCADGTKRKQIRRQGKFLED